METTLTGTMASVHAAAAPAYSAAVHHPACEAAQRLAAQHPPPTWAAGLQRGGAVVGRLGGSAPVAVAVRPQVRLLVVGGGQVSWVLTASAAPLSPCCAPSPCMSNPSLASPLQAAPAQAEPESEPMELSQGSDVKEEERWLAAQPWQPFPAPHPLDVEE